MIPRLAWAELVIGSGLLSSVAIATSACGARKESGASCEDGQAVYRRADGTEIHRLVCAGDEQCVELSPKQAVCRLFEACNAPVPAPSECRGDTLVRCNPGEQFRERLDCVTQNHGKAVPGRCASDAEPAADCVDKDAVRCDGSFDDSCVGDDRLMCRQGFTSLEPACNQDGLAQGGVCRVNAEGRAVCAQPAAEACFPDEPWGACEPLAIVKCKGGFVWRETCPEGESCAMDVEGDVQLAVCR